MRLLFLLLVLANTLFYAYTFVTRQQDGAASQIALLQINPEKIRIVNVGGGAAFVPSKPATAAACLEWGAFAGPEVARAEAAIARLDLPQALVQRTLADVGGYWVYMPPLKTRADVERKIGELKALGVTDFFVVQDQTQWRNAISLGIFKTEEAAKTFLAALREKGVRSAIVERRENFLKQVVYFVREPDESVVGRLTELQREFPASEIRAVACPPENPARS
ncbi:MAG: SPOR domain-containing protein [Burkholderiales bacterium]